MLKATYTPPQEPIRAQSVRAVVYIRRLGAQQKLFDTPFLIRSQLIVVQLKTKAGKQTVSGYLGFLLKNLPEEGGLQPKRSGFEQEGDFLLGLIFRLFAAYSVDTLSCLALFSGCWSVCFFVFFVQTKKINKTV